MGKSIAKALLWGALGLLIMFSLGGTVYMAGVTLVNWRVPLAVCAAIGVFTAPLQQLFRSRMALWLRCIIHAVSVTAIALCAFYLINMTTARNAPVRHDDVRVTRVYREKHYKSRRVSRRVYTRGAPYWVYYMEVEMPDGKPRQIRIGHNRYRHVDGGDTVGLGTRRGILGYDVIFPDDIIW